jgi:cephalosporin-C deacetylase-like acetyl esterase
VTFFMELKSGIKLIWFLLLFVTPGQVTLAQIKPCRDLARVFEYDQNGPLDIQENSVQDRNGVKVHDISYASPKGGRVTSYLIVPPGKGRFAGLIFLHPLGGNRNSFLAEALLLARVGAVSLLVDAPIARPGPWRREGFIIAEPETTRDLFIQTIVDLCRGVDLLILRPDVDAKRIGYVGFSLGATMGGILAGIEKRIKAGVKGDSKRG